MKKLLMTITLACVLSTTALAGEMPGVNSATAPEGTQSSIVVTVVLTIINIVVT